MIKKINLIALALAVCFTLLGCESMSQTSAGSAWRVFELAKLKNNQVIKQQKGATAQITVRENPSTGYHWTAISSNSAVTVTKGAYQSDRAREDKRRCSRHTHFCC